MKKKLAASFETTEALLMLGERLRTARLRRAETESMLATRLGVSRATIGRLERGDGGVSAALLLEALMQYGFSAQVFALADPDSDGVGKRLDALRRPARGRRQDSISRLDPTRL